MERPHWSYYLTVVQDLMAVSRHVELAEDNYSTYSIELVRMLLAIGSEIDVVAKVLCRQANPTTSAANMDEYRTILMGTYPSLTAVEVSMPKHGLTFTPWLEWRQAANPSWWRVYNKVKHERNEYYREANLRNVLQATAGLCVLVCYLYHEFFESEVIKRPLLFLDSKHISDGPLLYGNRYRLPDFQPPATTAPP